MDTDHRVESVNSLYTFVATCSEKVGVPKREAGGPPLGPPPRVSSVPTLIQNKNQFSVVS